MMGDEERSGFPVAFAAGIVIVLLLGAGLAFLIHATKPKGPARTEKVPFDAPAQAYAPRIHFKDIQMARSTNFLNQEFTFVAGTIANDGDRAIRTLQVTIEFHDPFNQVILTDTEKLIVPPAQALAGGQPRDFQVILEHVPSEWNRQYPAIRVTGLVLQ